MAPLHRAAAAAASDPQGAQVIQPDHQGPQMIQHFTHPHPLQHLHMSKDFTCNGCNIPGQGPSYNCSSCDFHLHELCARSPFTLSSPHLHPRHQLTLVNLPGKSHFCDLCGAIANGMFYTCQECDMDIHPHCSQLPLTVQHAFHPQHPLTLQPGHPSNSCNVCRQGCGTWRYKCNECNHVDVHLNCGMAPQPQQVQGGHSPAMTPKWVPPEPQQAQVGPSPATAPEWVRPQPQQAQVGHSPTTTPKWVLPQPQEAQVGHSPTTTPKWVPPQPQQAQVGHSLATTPKWVPQQAVGNPNSGGGNYGMNQPSTNYQTTQVLGHPSGDYVTNQPITNNQATQVVGNPNSGYGNYGTNQHVANYQTTQAVESPRGSSATNYGTNQSISYQTAQAVGHPSEGSGAIYATNQLVTNYQTTQAVGSPNGGSTANYGPNQPLTSYQPAQAVGHPSGGGGNYGIYQPATMGHPRGNGANYGMNQLVMNHQPAQVVMGGNYYGHNQPVSNYPTMAIQGVGYPGNFVGGYGNQQVRPVLQSQGSGNGRKNSGGQLASKLGKFAVNVVSTSIIGVPLLSTSSKK